MKAAVPGIVGLTGDPVVLVVRLARVVDADPRAWNTGLPAESGGEVGVRLRHRCVNGEGGGGAGGLLRSHKGDVAGVAGRKAEGRRSKGGDPSPTTVGVPKPQHGEQARIPPPRALTHRKLSPTSTHSSRSARCRLRPDT